MSQTNFLDIPLELSSTAKPNSNSAHEDAFQDLDQQQADLQFQNLEHDDTRIEIQETSLHENDHASLLNDSRAENKESQDDSNASVWTLNYYRRFFDVNTQQVAQRLFKALMPLQQFYTEESKPDLYGPFWISTTLIFLMAAAGNFANYLSHDDATEWSYDFTKLTVAATCLYAIITVVPLCVWFFLDRVGSKKGLVEVISVYGYSLFVFVPTSIICVLPSNFVRWISVIVSFGMSTLFLLRNLVPGIAGLDLPVANKTHGYIVLGAMICVHAGVALLMKFYFFSY